MYLTFIHAVVLWKAYQDALQEPKECGLFLRFATFSQSQVNYYLIYTLGLPNWEVQEFQTIAHASFK